MTDFQISAASMADMIAASKMINNWREPDPDVPGDVGGFIGSSRMGDGSVFALLIESSPRADGRVYGIGRWFPIDGVTPPPNPPGVLVEPLPDDSPVKWA